MRQDSLSIAEYFQEIRHPQLAPIISKMPEYFRRYDPAIFWRDLQAFITQDNIPKQAGFDLLIKLMNEEQISQIANVKYEFLLRGQRMKSQYRRSFIENRDDEGLKTKMLTFLNFMKMRHLPEHLILHNQLIERIYVSLETLLNHVGKQVHRIYITEVIRRLRESNREPFDVEKMLNNYELQKILEIIMPINLVELEMTYEKQRNGFLSNLTENSCVAQYNGETGSGKSTIALFSLGYDLKLEKDHQGLIQLVSKTEVNEMHKCILPRASIYSQTSSIHLVQPNYNFEIENLLFADKPGSSDTRSSTRQFYNLYMERQLYSKCKRMIFIEIVDVKQLTEKLNRLKQFTMKIARKYEYRTVEDMREFLVIILNKCDCYLQQIDRLTSFLEQALNLQHYAVGKERTVLEFMQRQLYQTRRTRQHVFTVDFYEDLSKRQSFFNYLRSKIFKDPQQVVTTAIKPEIKTAILSTFSNFSHYLSLDFAQNQQSIAFYYKQCCRLINYTRLFPIIQEERSIEILIMKMNTTMENFIKSKAQIQVNLNHTTAEIQTFLHDNNKQTINQSIPRQTNQKLQMLKLYSNIFETEFSEEQELDAIKILIEQETHMIEELLRQRLKYSQNDLKKYKENLNKYAKMNQLRNIFPQFSTDFLNYFSKVHQYFDKIFESILGKLYNTSRFNRFMTAISNDKDSYLQFLSFASSVFLSNRVDYLDKYAGQLEEKLYNIGNNCYKVMKSKINFKNKQIPQIKRDFQLSIKELNILLEFIEDVKNIEYLKKLDYIQIVDKDFHRILQKEINILKKELSKYIQQRNRSIFEESTKEEIMNQILQLSNSPILTNDQIKRRETEQLISSVQQLVLEGNTIFTKSSQNSSQRSIFERGIFKSTFGFFVGLFDRKQ